MHLGVCVLEVVAVIYVRHTVMQIRFCPKADWYIENSKFAACSRGIYQVLKTVREIIKICQPRNHFTNAKKYKAALLSNKH